MKFIYLIKLSTSSSIKLDFDDDVDSDISYGLIRIIFSFFILPLFDSFSCSSFLYNSCISQILSSTYWFHFPLYASSLSANILWVWNIQSSMLFWIKYCRSSDISNMLVEFMVQLLILAYKIVCSISVIIMLVSPTIFIISYTCFCILIIASIPFSVLWYSLVQSSHSSLNTLASSILFNFLVMYRFGKVSIVA